MSAPLRDAVPIVGGRVRITVLTNSLEATDVAAVHAGYAKRRKDLLAAGVRRFEMKRELGRSVRRPRLTEPGAGFWRRAGVRLLELIPIEWML